MLRLRQRRRADDAPDPHGSAPPARASEHLGADRLAAAGDPANVQVIYGAGAHSLPLVGLTIAQARSLVETIARLHPRSPALVNGEPVRAGYVLVQGDVLEFVHHAGEKGH